MPTRGVVEVLREAKDEGELGAIRRATAITNEAYARLAEQRFVGRTVDVLVEGASRTDPAKLRGRSSHNKVVNFSGLARPGDIVPVEILGATIQTLAGEEVLLARCANA